MNIHFWKMHGAGNDFILVDDRAQTFPADDTAWLQSIGARKTGVGCDGIILIQPSETADFRMRFFNPDGSEADMCGNGARCVARLACEIGAAPSSMTIETLAGRLHAHAQGDQVLLHMTEPRDWRLEATLDLPGETVAYGLVNTGVPHAVTEVADLASYDVQGRGRLMRRHQAFAPDGANANFVQVTGPQALRVRTYERGVEAETLACGTGIVAAALVMTLAGRVVAPVEVIPTGGDRLVVNFERTGDEVRKVTLRGPAVHVFAGQLAYVRS
jgi:diaminopimelate epimerase